MAIKIGFAVLAIVLGGCSIVSYQHGDVAFSRTTLGTDTELQGLRVHVDADGSRTLELEGVSSQQTQALEAVARGAAEGAAKAIGP